MKLFEIRFSFKHCNFSRGLPARQDGFQNRDKVYLAHNWPFSVTFIATIWGHISATVPFSFWKVANNELQNIDRPAESGFMLERGLAGSPQFGKKCRKKFTLPRQMGRAKISTIFFFNKVFENITDNNTDFTALYKLTLDFYSLLRSQWPFSSLFESLFHQTNIRDSAVIRAQAFSVAQNVPKWRQSVRRVRPM